MKITKKFVSTFLCFAILIPSIIMLSGCRDNNRNVSDFVSIYNSFLNNNSDIIEIDTSSNVTATSNSYMNTFELIASDNVTSAINSSFKYEILRDYFPKIYTNAMDATYYYMPIIIKNSKKISTVNCDKIYSAYDSLTSDLTFLFNSMADLNLSFEFTGADGFDAIPNIARLEILIDAFIECIDSANSLSDIILDLYESKIYTSIGTIDSKNFETSTDTSIIFGHIRYLIYKYKTITSSVYYSLSLDGLDVSSLIINEVAPFDSATNFESTTAYNFLNSILHIVPDDTLTNNYNNMVSNQDIIISVFNSINEYMDVLDIDYEFFKECSNHISYSNVLGNSQRYDYEDVEYFNFMNYYYYGNYIYIENSIYTLLNNSI